MSAPVPTLSRKTIRLLDRLTIEYLGIPGLILMENAGTGCACLLRERIETGTLREPVLVLAGPGNNGGDGFVVARHVANAGIAVEVVFFGTAAKLRSGSDAEVNFRALKATGVRWREAHTLCGELSCVIEQGGCFVDALFGTGLARPLEEPFLSLFRAIQDSGKPVLAVDTPSGLDPDTGAVLGAALPATFTATFVAAKPGFFSAAGPTVTGEITIVPISIPRTLLRQAFDDEEAFWAWAEEKLSGKTR